MCWDKPQMWTRLQQQQSQGGHGHGCVVSDIPPGYHKYIGMRQYITGNLEFDKKINSVWAIYINNKKRFIRWEYPLQEKTSDYLLGANDREHDGSKAFCSKDFVWHHCELNSDLCTCTLQMVPETSHQSIRHYGAIDQVNRQYQPDSSWPRPPSPPPPSRP
jgi:hypothetical protein